MWILADQNLSKMLSGEEFSNTVWTTEKHRMMDSIVHDGVMKTGECYILASQICECSNQGPLSKQ